VYKRWWAGVAAVVAMVVGVALWMGTPGHEQPAGAGQDLAASRPDAVTPVPSVAGTPVTTASARRTPAEAAPSSSVAARASATPSPSAKPAPVTLAGRIRPATTYRGKATFYDAGNGDGACLFGASDDMMIGAMNQTDYETAKACGAYVQIRGVNGGSVTVRITNLCPLPCAPGQIDLSPQAFAKLGKREQGEVPITWKLVSPPLTSAISIRYKTGSSQYWCGLQVINHRNMVARLEVRTSGGWRRLARTGFNYFISENGDGCGKAIRVTDIYGQRLTFTGIAIDPDVAQATNAQFARH
jgi:expansin (peptidoglycan-binding protein)